MSIPLAMVFLVCLVAGANASGQRGSFTAADLKKLEKLLRTKPSYGGGRVDLALIEQEVHHLEGGAKRAAQAILALKGVEVCNEEALSVLVQIDGFGKNYDDYGQRCRRLIAPLGENISNICSNYIEQTAANKSGQLASDRKVAKLFQVLNGSHATVGYRMNPNSSRVIFNGNFLRKLAEEDSGPILAGNRAQFDQLVQAYIVEPCKKITGSLGHLYRQSRAVASHQSDWMTFHEYTSVSFKNVLWAHQSCERLLSMNDQQKSRMFQEM